MRRGRIRIRNKMGFQIVTILIFTIILPSIFFFWFIVQRYREQYEQQVLEREGKCVWLPTNVMQGSFARKPKDYALARAINAPDGQVGVFYMFLSSDHLWKILTNPLLTEGSSHYYLLAPDGRIVMLDLDALTGTDMQLDFTLAQFDGQSGHLLITGEGGRRQVATYVRVESTGWVSVILADRDELYSNAISRMRLWRRRTSPSPSGPWTGITWDIPA